MAKKFSSPQSNWLTKFGSQSEPRLLFYSRKRGNVQGTRGIQLEPSNNLGSGIHSANRKKHSRQIEILKNDWSTSFPNRKMCTPQTLFALPSLIVRFTMSSYIFSFKKNGDQQTYIFLETMQFGESENQCLHLRKYLHSRHFGFSKWLP